MSFVYTLNTKYNSKPYIKWFILMKIGDFSNCSELDYFPILKNISFV